LRFIECKFAKLDKFHLLDNADLRKRLRNSRQFINTIAEIDVILHLANSGLRSEWGHSWPDIVLPEMGIGVEVKTLGMSEKLKDSKGKAVEIDDIGRLDARIQAEVLPRLGPDTTCILVVGADDLSFGEFVDYFSSCSEIAGATTTIGVLRWQGGAFSCPEFASLIAAVMMKDPFKRWLNPWRRATTCPIDSEFKGLLNPRRTTDVPMNLRQAFNMAVSAIPSEGVSDY
jgi:hypothetical protein